MPPDRTTGRIQKPAQRRPRIGKACNACRAAKQRCEPPEYGKSDRACRRCLSHGLDCNLPQEARSQSPTSAVTVQGPASSDTSGSLTLGAEHGVQYMLIQSESTQFPVGGWTAPRDRSVRSQSPSAGVGVQGSPSSGTSGNPTSGTGPSVQYMLPQFESPQFPVGSWTTPTIRSEESQGQGTGIHAPGPTQGIAQITNFLSLAPSIHGHGQNPPNDSQEVIMHESFYYPEEYYAQGQSSSAYVPHFVRRGASNNMQNLYVDELEDYRVSSLANEKNDVGPSHSGES